MSFADSGARAPQAPAKPVEALSEDQSKGFRPYAQRRSQSGNLDDSTAHGGATEPTASQISSLRNGVATHLSALAETATHMSGAGNAAAGSDDTFGRNRSITSGRARPAVAAVAAAADLALGRAPPGVGTFTQGFPPGPQQLLSQLPWYLQLQGMGQAAAQEAAAANAAAALVRGPSAPPQQPGEQRSSSFPADARQLFLSLNSQGTSQGPGPSQLSGQKRKDSIGAAGTDNADTGDDDDGGQRFDGMEGDDDDEDPEQRAKRRLAQNREAARKSRQRRKQYVQKLEEEVLMLRWQVQQAQGKTGKAPPRAPSAGAAQAGAALSNPASNRSRSLSASPAAAPSEQAAAPSAGLPPLAGLAASPGATPAAPAAAAAAAAVAGLSGAAAAPLMTMDTTQVSALASAASIARGSWLPEGSQAAAERQAADVLAAFAKWRLEHAETAAALRQTLDQGGAEAQLKPLISDARAQLWSHFQMKKAVVGSEAVLLVLAGEHLPPPERSFAWLGTARPSDACAGLLAAQGPSLAPPQLQKLESLKESMLQLENVLSRGFESITAELRGRAVKQLASSAADAGQAWAGAEVTGRLDALRMLLLRADGAWEQLLEDIQKALPPRVYAAALISLHEMGRQLQAMHRPWLAQLRTAAAPAQQS